MTTSMRIAFAGTPAFAVAAFDALVEAGHPPVRVLTQPDRPAGRGRRPTASPVKQAAAAHGVDVLQPAGFTRSADSETLARLGPRPDLLVVVAYGLLLPRWLLDWPRVASVNLHASLLPRWRGAAPIQYAILAGDRETGVSLMRIEPALDAGPVYATRATPIGATETAGSLQERLAGLGAGLLVDSLPALLAGTLVPQAQDPALATHAPKIAKADAVLDWTRPAAELERRVRAFVPWPVAETRFADSGERLRIRAAETLAAAAAAAAPGTIVAAGARGIDVATGEGVLRVTRVQPSSGRQMDAAAYLAAHAVGGRRFAARPG